MNLGQETAQFAVDVLAGLVGTLITAVLIAPLVGVYVDRRHNGRWRNFRKHIGQLMERNQTELGAAIASGSNYLEGLSRLDPHDVKAVEWEAFNEHRDALRTAITRMENVGVRFHFAMSPRIMEKWQEYHVLALSKLRVENEHIWSNVAGVIAAIKRGYDFDPNPNMFDDAFTQPVLYAARNLAKIDITALDSGLVRFIRILTR